MVAQELANQAVAEVRAISERYELHRAPRAAKRRRIAVSGGSISGSAASAVAAEMAAAEDAVERAAETADSLAEPACPTGGIPIDPALLGGMTAEMATVGPTRGLEGVSIST